MISAKGLDDLVRHYQHALGKVNDAAAIFEDVSLIISAAGQQFTRESTRLIEHTNALYVEINQTIGRLREVTPDD
jgi:hypothetical protein